MATKTKTNQPTTAQAAQPSIGVFDHLIQPKPMPDHYPAEIETRRAFYEALADSVALQTHLHYEEDLLEIHNPDFHDKDSRVMPALMEHWERFAFGFQWTEPRTLRKFYAELRLWNDYLQWEQEQESAARKDQPRQAARA